MTGKYRNASRRVRGTEAQANRELRKLIKEVEEGRHHSPRMTVEQLIADHLARQNGRAHCTVSTQAAASRRVVAGLGHIRIDKLTREDVSRFLSACQERYMIGTVRGYKSILAGALDSAIERGWLVENVARGHRLRSGVTKEVVPPTPDQVWKLISAAQDRDPEFGMFVRLAAATGARRGELLGLRRSSLIGDDTLVIVNNVTPGEGGISVGTTKTRQSRRQVTLDPNTVMALKAHLARQDSLGTITEADPFIFLGCPQGCHPMPPTTATGSFIAVRDKLGLTTRLHDLRHFSITQQLSAGVPVANVAGRHGNSPTVIHKTYSHFIPGSDHMAAAVMGNLLPPP
ncbi:MAG: site-specific integrase [Acidimicrobiia bacterium]|nr:site-specific integrase [Acidimicrobiia bacterium]